MFMNFWWGRKRQTVQSSESERSAAPAGTSGLPEDAGSSPRFFLGLAGYRPA